MQDGYYWVFFEGDDPQVAEMSDGQMYLCGSDIGCRVVNGEWCEAGIPMRVVSIIGPLVPPCHG